MKKKLKVVTGMMVGAALAWAWNASAASQACSLPDQIISYRVVGNATSFTPAQFTDVPAGYSITNGIYEGWCVQYDTFIAAGPLYHGGLYDTHGPLPIQLRNLPWDKINYVLNHKRGSAWDVQYVIWHILGQAPNPPANTPMVEMIADVAQNGAGFVPTHGQVVGVLVESQEGVQRLIIETIWDQRCRDTVAPVAALASPASHSVYTDACTVPLVANVQDNLGVTRVEFYYGTQLVHVCLAPPYTCPWPVTEANNGTHEWSVKAYDYAGNSMASAPLAVTVSIDVVAPTVAIVSPASETRFANAQTVGLTVAADDNFGVTRVELFDRGVLKTTLNSAPFIYPWAITAADNGTHNWTARAYDAAGNSTISAVVALDVAIDAEPPSLFFTTPANGSRFTSAGAVELQVQAFDNFGVSRVEFYNGAALVATRTQAPYTISWSVSSALNGTHHWTARAYDAAGLNTLSSVLNLEVDIDIELPSVVIVSPAEGASLTNQLVVVQGTANDNKQVQRVEYQVDDGPYALAQGTTSWQVQLALAPGLHSVRVRSVDSAGHVSLSVLRTFRYYETEALQVRMTGAGTVTPNLNGAPLELNKTYQLTATPAIGYSFSNWSGGVVGTSRQLDFVMQPSLLVQANFISTPFKPVAATYNGLFYESNGIAHVSSGFFELRTTARGTFSALLLVAGQKIRASGTFDAESKATVVVARRKASPMVIRLHLFTLENHDYVQGQVSDGVWTADLIGDRVAFYLRGQNSPFTGSYTVVLPGDTQTGPSGNGFGSVSVARNGGVRLSATLGDGTRVSQRAYVSGSGQWPLYAALYKSQGSVCGWLTFTNSAQDDLVGEISWNKPSNVRDRVYPGGFTNITTVIGSSYRYTKGVVVPNIPEGVIHFAEGGLAESFSNLVNIDYRNRVLNLSPNALSMSVAPKSGAVRGKVMPPGINRWLGFQGIVHQKRNMAYGFFTGTGVTGSVLLESR